ncbi:YbfB/YjiJ family MFS transporter [Saccharothrix sp. NPDC042600]|uniref:YbfB/YjiJ family MFS transporter n=1 Tax=Saccharothrix TaxID=2071 RepID=UPI0033CDE6F9|nr:YbfB/YjiJ family MFS transporter [Saccharothrix mutabilis subsp. capreolus]
MGRDGAVTTRFAVAARLSLGTASALGFARFAYGLVLPGMRDDLGWTLAAAGAMSTANGLGYLVGALAAAPLVRRLGTTAAFRWGMATTALTLAGIAVSADFTVLLVVRAASGVSGALVFVTGGVIAARANVLTVYFAGAGLGIVVSGATIPALGDHWRVVWLGMGLAAALATAISWTAARTEDAPGDAGGKADLRALAPVAVAYALFAVGYITYITFLSAYLADRGTPVVGVALTWTVLGLAVVCAPVLWDRPLRTWPGGRALAAVLALLGASAALALTGAVVPSAVLYGLTFMCVPAAVTVLIKARAADPTATLAAFTTVFAAGQTVGPWLAGLVADRTSTDATLVWTAVLCWAGAAVALAVRPENQRDRETELRRRAAGR